MIHNRYFDISEVLHLAIDSILKLIDTEKKVKKNW